MTEAVAIDLPLEPESARRAREHLEPFRKALDETAFFDLRLLVSELVVEVLHDGERTHEQEIELRVELRDGRVHAEVAEGGDAFRLPSGHPEPGETGWGLYLVGRLASRWGIRREPQRSGVWLELPLAGRAT
jgi:anti-sigma regulatory factor (Ser/Thr protein kinase)